MFGFFKKQKWLHVKTITLGNLIYGSSDSKKAKDVKIFIQLFESDRGNRKIETACSLSDVSQEKIDIFVKASDEYQLRILRWASGRADPEIPRYSQLGEEDTANALKGKID